jgi:putative membrane-bound dehydrogenase-like protein
MKVGRFWDHCRHCMRGVCIVGSITLSMGVMAQLSPEEAVQRLTVAEDMEVTLFAAEPMLRNPTCIDVDAQGRVWVAEAANYRLFNQQVVDEEGDRIRVLEDTDGDGKADKATTYYQDKSLQAPMGIAVLGNRVYVCQSPEVFYLEDTDGDGKADKKTVILTGFKGVDHDHAIHGILYGPDGYLYMSCGDQGMEVTDGSGHLTHTGPQSPNYIAATVLRTDLEGKHLEVLASNMRNPYEPAVDSYGNVYISDNDDDGNEQTRIDYVFEGGTYGYRMPDTVSRRKGNRRLDAVHWNEDQPGVVPKMINTGFGSPTGLMVYEGSHLPRRLTGQLIHCDAGPREVRAFYPRPDGAGKKAEKEILVSAPNDSWFRPSDACAAPDGSVFISDWYDAGVGGHRMVEAKKGRIYRLTKKNNQEKYTITKPDFDTPKGMIAGMMSPNQATKYLAYQAWNNHSNPEYIMGLIMGAKAAINDPELYHKVFAPRVYWQMIQQPNYRFEIADHFLFTYTIEDGESDPVNELDINDTRIMALRGISRFVDGADALINRILKDPDPGLRRQLLLEMAFPYPEGQGHLSTQIKERTYLFRLKLLQRQYDGNDRFYREALGIAARGRESEAFAMAQEHFGAEGWNPELGGLAFQYHPVEAFDLASGAFEDATLSFELRELALRTIAAIGNDIASEYLVNTATTSSEAKMQVLAFQLLGRHGGDIWREAMNKHDFDTKISAALESGNSTEGILTFIRAANRTGSIEPLLKAVTTLKLDPVVQVDYLTTLETIIGSGEYKLHDDWVEQLSPLLDSPEVAVQTKTVATIARLRGKSVAEALVPFIQNAKHDRAPRAEAVRSLASNKRSVKDLLEWAKEGKVPEDIKVSVAEALRNTSVAEVQTEAISLFPPNVSKSGKPLPTVKQLLAEKGEAVNGKKIYFDENKSTCSRCHDIATGGPEIGPNLGKIGEKLAKQSLLESILDPNAAISHEYQAWFIDTKDEEGLLGYIRSEDATTLELMDSNGAISRIPVNSITQREVGAVSIMPSGLTAGMSVQELVDLIAFLETLK